MKIANFGILLVCGALLGAVAWSGCNKRSTSTIPAGLVTCSYGGNVYEVGATFPDLDGCNTCECTASGEVACTLMACACDPANEPQRSYISTDPEVCARIRFFCEVGMEPFFNECGCGCEPATATNP